ncbi:hypothetical protein QVD17_13017 [Tagetes erecta]|uniref:Reverse transcriptase domain-containing protein n=1 Tax=Tagetes erecta TaxID=13708 RepID=A0AAD8L031_TARER|nr:hypothetical protein QVD17_13017 [Tagetes erecta]
MNQFKSFTTPNQGPSISHLFFADDATIIGDLSMENANSIKRLLRCFYLISGLKINFNKSVLYGVNLDHDEIHLTASVIKCQSGSIPFTYLGLTVGANMNRICNWAPVINTFDARLSKWKTNTLSIGGRLTILKSVLEALPTYFFSIYKAPKKIIDILEAKRRRFLWGSDENARSVNWVSWDQVTTLKAQGGLGLTPLRDANVSLQNGGGDLKQRNIVYGDVSFSQYIIYLDVIRSSHIKNTVQERRNTWLWRWKRQSLDQNEAQQLHNCQSILAQVHL